MSYQIFFFISFKKHHNSLGVQEPINHLEKGEEIDILHVCIHKCIYYIVYSIMSQLKIGSGFYTAVLYCLCVSSGLIKHKNIIRLNHCPFVRYSDNLSVHCLLLIIISVYQHTVQSKQPLISIIIF
jgi:hypothetical protein